MESYHDDGYTRDQFDREQGTKPWKPHYEKVIDLKVSMRNKLCVCVEPAIDPQRPTDICLKCNLEIKN